MKAMAPHRNIWYFVPLLVFYIIIIAAFSSDNLVADEARHMRYATNLTQGFYTETDNPELRNGPGYPLVISLLKLISAPQKVYKLMNAAFLIMAVVFFYKIIGRFINPKLSVILAYIFGLYPPFLKWMVYIHSESLSVFLMCGFLFFTLNAHSVESKKIMNAVFAAFFIGFLTLTKVIFGYVIIASALLYLLIYLFTRTVKSRSGLLILVAGFLFCVPYLYYTYTLTGKLIYWGTQGGEILYWRSTPYPNEYGDWISEDVILGNRDDDLYDTSFLVKNHLKFYESMESYSYVRRDELFKEEAIKNILQYPLKYLNNTGTSGLRLFFNYPNTYTPQKTTSFFYILPNGLLLFFLLCALYLSIKRPGAIPFEVRYIGLITLIFMSGLVLLSGRVRHLLPAIPVILYFIIYVFHHLLNVKIKKVGTSSTSI